MGEQGSFETRRPRSRRWKNFGRRWTMGVGDLENWTIFMNFISVSSLIKFTFVTRKRENKSARIELVTRSKFFLLFHLELVTRKRKKKSLTIELVT